MSARGRTPPYVSLEVWLGPMEGLRYLGEWEASPFVRIGRLGSDKRGAMNQLVLTRGVGVSGAHAELRVEAGRILLKDLDSTNGTFVAQKKIPKDADVELRSGDVFLVSFTPIRVELVDDPGTTTIAPDSLTADTWKDPLLQSVLDGARKAAEQRGEAYLDSRHLCDGLFRTRNPWVQRRLREVNWSREDALAELWEGGLWPGNLKWLAEVLNRPVEQKTGAPDYLVSPKAAGILEGASRHLRHGSGEDTEVGVRTDLLNLLLQDGGGAVGGWLLSHGLAMKRSERGGTGRQRLGDAGGSPIAPPQPVERAAPLRPAATGILESPLPQPDHASPRRTDELPMAAAPISEVSARRNVPPEVVQEARRFPTAAVAAPEPAISSRPASRELASRAEPASRAQQASRAEPAYAPAAALTPGILQAVAEPALTEQAREIARELVETAAAYRFSTAADRREALRSRLTRELAAVAPEKRPRLIENVRQHFPVLSGSPAASDEEAERLRKEVRALERELSIASQKASQPRGGGSGIDKIFSESKTTDSRVMALRETLEFAVTLERFLLGLVQAITMPGADTTEKFRFGGFKLSLGEALETMKAGKPVDLEQLTRYLAHLGRWQVAITAAHHEAPKIWFQKHWKRVNPTAIEGAPRPAGWKLRSDAADWWELYKTSVSGLTPDVVQDQVLQIASHFAKDEFEKLRKRKGDR